MLRLLWGVVLAGLVGGAIAALASNVLGITTLSASAAYPLAVAVGIIVGLLAGKPIWAEGARVEAGLKAAFGALLAAGLMWALRAWITFDLDLSSAGLGRGPASLLPVIAFPSVALVLSLLFEIDNMFGSKDDGEGSNENKRIAAGKSVLRVGEQDPVETELEDDQNSAVRRKR